jgi:hypothetical protein
VAVCVSSDVRRASGSGRPVPRPAAFALASSASMFSMCSCALHEAASLDQSGSQAARQARILPPCCSVRRSPAVRRQSQRLLRGVC